MNNDPIEALKPYSIMYIVVSQKLQEMMREELKNNFVKVLKSSTTKEIEDNLKSIEEYAKNNPSFHDAMKQRFNDDLIQMSDEFAKETENMQKEQEHKMWWGEPKKDPVTYSQLKEAVVGLFNDKTVSCIDKMRPLQMANNIVMAEAQNLINKEKMKNEYTKPYDPPEYSASANVTYTISVLKDELDVLRKEILELVERGEKVEVGRINEINRKIYELQNNISFLKEYR